MQKIEVNEEIEMDEWASFYEGSTDEDVDDDDLPCSNLDSA